MTAFKRLVRRITTAIWGVMAILSLLWLMTALFRVTVVGQVYADTGWPWAIQVVVRDGWLSTLFGSADVSGLSPEQRAVAVEHVFPPEVAGRFAFLGGLHDSSFVPRTPAGWRPRFVVRRSGNWNEFASYDAHWPVTVPAGFLLASMFLAYRHWAAWRRLQIAAKQGLCVGCGYDLRGSADAGRCPECAMPFDVKLRE